MADTSNASAPVVVIPKPWWKSATLWTNILSIIGLLAAAPEIVELLGAALGLQTAGAVLGVLNLLLRYFKSTAPIAGSPPDNAATQASASDARRAVAEAAEGGGNDKS